MDADENNKSKMVEDIVSFTTFLTAMVVSMRSGKQLAFLIYGILWFLLPHIYTAYMFLTSGCINKSQVLDGCSVMVCVEKGEIVTKDSAAFFDRCFRRADFIRIMTTLLFIITCSISDKVVFKII